MKKLLLTLSAVLFMATGLLAKIPQNFNYQAVVRNNAGELVKNQQVGVKVTIIKTIRQQQIVNKTDLYVETFTKLTNANGLLSLKIGTGTPVTGQFSDIDFNIPENISLTRQAKEEFELDRIGIKTTMGVDFPLQKYKFMNISIFKEGSVPNIDDSFLVNDINFCINTIRELYEQLVPNW